MRPGDITDGITDGLTRGFESLGAGVSGLVSETSVRLGVTGLSRAGKTVFITSLVANLLDRGRMPQFLPAARGDIESAFLQPQPNVTVPRFDYENHLAALSGPDPHWPQSTRAVSELRLSFRLRPRGVLRGVSGPRRVHLDIVDYPGEWLLDLSLLEKSYTTWSRETLTRLQSRPLAAPYLELAAGLDANALFDEADARALASSFTACLNAARDAGYVDCTPGRFLLPGELEGSPALTFGPLSGPDRPSRKGLWREMERRYDAYKSRIVKPFFRDHFARIDRQIVLVDALGAIHRGPEAVGDLQKAMGEILSGFRPGRNSFLSRLFVGRRIDKILFAATKADHLHHHQHPRLTAIMQAMLRRASEQAQFAGADTGVMAIASLRATVEERLKHDGMMLDCVRGRLLDGGRQAAFYPGELPEDPAILLDAVHKGAAKWLDADYGMMAFAPAPLALKPGDGPPHIRLDKALQFLIGDLL